MNQNQAQERIDRIAAFRDELAALEAEGVPVSEEMRDHIQRHHQELLTRLSGLFDIDVSTGQKQLSLGMRITSFFGAMALAAALLFFFLRFWGHLTTPAQVAIAIALPLSLTLGVHFAAVREKTRYFASLIAFIAFAAFVIDLQVLGTVFNIAASPNAFLVWGAFAMVLAYGYGLRLMLVAGLTCGTAWLSAEVGTWSGVYWLSFGHRPENFLLAGGLIAAVGALSLRWQSHFATTYRVYGLLVVFLAVLILANWGRVSYLPFTSGTVEEIYQLSGFVLSALAIWAGIRHGWPGVVKVGITFFVLFLYTKVFDWWWDWLPKYVFFLLVGLISVGILIMLRKVRAMGREVPA